MRGLVVQGARNGSPYRHVLELSFASPNQLKIASSAGITSQPRLVFRHGQPATWSA